MTSVVAWCGVDRGPASIYIATDSRVTQGRALVSDGTRKTYAASRSAQIFAYCGHVLGPASTLGSVSEMLERMEPADSVDMAEDQFRRAVDACWSLHQPVPAETILVHAVRCGGPAVKDAEFGLQIVRIPAGSKEIRFESLEMPVDQSSQLVVLGSGEREVQKHVGRWVPTFKADSRDRTSRAVFSSFCDSIAAGVDPYSGGAPQLVGLRRKGSALTFGVVWNGRPYVNGVPDIGDDNRVEFFDRRFQRVDRHGNLLPGAKRHPELTSS